MKTFKEFLTESMDKVVFDVYGGKEYHWPIVKGWTVVDTDKTDRFGTAGEIALQDDLGTGTIVRFDASSMQDGKKGKGTYEFTYYGKDVKGTFKSVKDIPNVVRQITKQFPKIKDKQMKKIPSSVAGYKLDPMDDYSTELHYTKDMSSDLLSNVNFFDFDELMQGGRGEVLASVNDHGGYETGTIFNKRYMATGMESIPKILKQFDKDFQKADK